MLISSLADRRVEVERGGVEGRNLPPDEALAAYASVNARATEYKKSKAFPGASMEEFRAMAYLDLLSGETAVGRIAKAQAKAAADRHRAESADARNPSRNGDPSDCPCRECDGGCMPVLDEDEYDGDESRDECPDEDDSGDDDPGGAGPGGIHPSGDGPGGDGPTSAGRGAGDASPGNTGPGDNGSGPEIGLPSDPSESPDEHPEPTRLTDLVIPLLTLLGLAERPGEGHGFGPLDPALCRDLAAAAANSLRSEWCLTVTDENGFAVGHGCARRGPGDKAAWKPSGIQPARLMALPSKVNLTIPATALHSLAAQTGDWTFTPHEGMGAPGDEGPPGRTSPPRSHQDGYGTWTFTLPGGRKLTVKIDPVPTYACDHRNESHAYQPNDTLRHLVQIRDGNCTFPPCSRHARDTDFEHATPYHKGGRTCACNAGVRSRKCHRIKQSPGWEVTQPRPGWHQWTTPSGRTYTQEPKRYPA